MSTKTKVDEETPGVLASKTSTKWINLQKIKVKPKVLKTQDYKPIHRADLSSHTRIVPSAENMIAQLDRSNGGFYVKLVPSVTGWGGWIDLQKEGIELLDLRCVVCMQRVPLNPNLIAKHFKTHRSIFGKPRPGGEFYFTISRNNPLPEEDDSDEDINVETLD